jgi:hypothetical protein
MEQITTYKEDEQGRRVDLLSSFKTAELVGYQVSSFMLAGMTADGNMKEQLLTNSEEKQDLLKYMYQKYFQDQSGTVDRYMEQVRKRAKTQVITDAAEERFFPKDQQEVDDKIEETALKMFFARAKSRMLVEHIPTKYMRLSRTRTSEDGTSDFRKVMNELVQTPGHEHLRKPGGRVDYDRYGDIVGYMMRAEAAIRDEVSAVAVKEQAGDNPDGKPKELHEVDISDHTWKNNEGEDSGLRLDYSLRNEEQLEWVLENKVFPKTESMSADQLTERDRNIRDTKTLYRILRSKYMEDEAFLDKFAEEIAAREYPFTLALEDTDLQLMPVRAGQKLLERKFSDHASTEKTVVPKIMELYPTLKQLAADTKGDEGQKFEKISEILKEIHDTIQQGEGTDVALLRSEELATAIIFYFKKDSGTDIPVVGKYWERGFNSIAAEDLGRAMDVWEWETQEIHKFLDVLVKNKVLREDPYERDKPIEFIPQTKVDTLAEEIIFDNWLTRAKPTIFNADGEVADIDRIRDELGADTLRNIVAVFMKYGIMAVAIAFSAILLAAFNAEKGSIDDQK